MGIFTRSDWEGAVLGIVLVCFVFHAALLRALWQISAAIKANTRRSSVEETDESLCPCDCGGWRLTMHWTKASVVCFCVACFGGVVQRLFYFTLCHDCAVRSALWVLYIYLGFLGYAFMFAAHFERLRLTFSDSALALPKWASALMYGMCLLLASLFCCTSLLRFSQPKWASASQSLTIVLYFVGVVLMIRVFNKKMLAAANTTPPDPALLEVAVRLTLLVTVSVLSTALSLVMWSLILRFCNLCYFWLIVGNAVFYLDQCLNSFCLLCTFSLAIGHYRRVFGPLHAAILLNVSQKLPIADPMSRRKVMSATGDDRDDDAL